VSTPDGNPDGSEQLEAVSIRVEAVPGALRFMKNNTGIQAADRVLLETAAQVIEQLVKDIKQLKQKR
jgi:hypothetical protein